MHLDGSGGGHIELSRTYQYGMGWGNRKQEPPIALDGISLIPDGFSLKERFDVELNYRDYTPSEVQAWVTAMQEGECFTEMATAFNFCSLPVSLEDIALLWKRQTASPHQRLSTIYGISMLPWDIHHFQSFAAIVSPSLTFLNLATRIDYEERPKRPYRPDQLATTFDDLPSLVAIIRDTLPRLSTLIIGMKGVETADDLCAAHLNDKVLDQEGAIVTLHIVTAIHLTPLWNVIRVVSQICKGAATIHIDHTEAYSAERIRKEQTACLGYLRE